MSTSSKPVDPAFVNRKEELRFYLLKLDGAQRCDHLGITEDLYESKRKATAWRDRIAKHFVDGDPNDQPALAKLKDMHKTMTDF